MQNMSTPPPPPPPSLAALFVGRFYFSRSHRTWPPAWVKLTADAHAARDIEDKALVVAKGMFGPTVPPPQQDGATVSSSATAPLFSWNLLFIEYFQKVASSVTKITPLQE